MLVVLKEVSVIEISSLLQSRVHRGHSGGVEGVGRKKVNGQMSVAKKNILTS